MAFAFKCDLGIIKMNFHLKIKFLAAMVQKLQPVQETDGCKDTGRIDSFESIGMKS